MSRDKSIKIDSEVNMLVEQLKVFLMKKQPLSYYSKKKILRLAVLNFLKQVKNDYKLD